MKLKDTDSGLRYYPMYKLGIHVYQEGGEVKVTQDQQSQDPIMKIVQMAVQAVQNNDTALAMEVCRALVALLNQQQQQPSPETNEEEETKEEPQMI